MVGVRKANTAASAIRRRRVFICVFLLMWQVRAGLKRNSQRASCFHFRVGFRFADYRLALAVQSDCGDSMANGRKESGFIDFELHGIEGSRQAVSWQRSSLRANSARRKVR